VDKSISEGLGEGLSGGEGSSFQSQDVIKMVCLVVSGPPRVLRPSEMSELTEW
jgi:hypothetical protein